MKFRIPILTYMVAFLAGAAFKLIQYIIQPEAVADFNTVIVELTIVSALVAGGVSIFYAFKAKKNNPE
ncbi:hypothetical protein DYD21_02880 [Rhodohalobacter sp. SW132]|uniref:hypothetical protein n=1 Tax=Rhodohalobacter sp. SW132 TaxID=2293433 RepID=UPI000E26C8EC|nr:hypothetical protein [Rhodohalobacter sp. SW132]REL38914.1 hypothetical protein DYD21_02880 [Rhodohalobacter sp. SW132]